MAIIDDLKILITADARGMESVLKKSIQTVTGAVGKMNAEEVDWTSIFTRSVSPAIISGVASVFAFAISESVQFQQQLNTAGTAAGESSSQIAQVGQSALQTSKIVPASAEDIANAMFKLSAVFSKTNDQQQVAQDMAQLSASGFGDLTDIVDSSIQIFKDFGVTTTDQAVQVLDDLMHAAQGAKESIPQITGQFEPFAVALANAGVNAGNLNGALSVFAGEVQTVGSRNASQIFSALADASKSSIAPMNFLGTSLSAVRKSLVEDGGLSAITQVSEHIKEMGSGAYIVATALGLSADQVTAFQKNASSLPTLNKNIKDIATNTQSIKDAFNESDNAMRDLQKDWNDLRAALIPIGDVLVKGLSKAVTFVSDGLKGIGELWTDTVGGMGRDWDKFADTAFGKQFTSKATAALNVVGDSLSSQGAWSLTHLSTDNNIKLITQSLEKSGLNDKSIYSIEETARQSNLVPQLLQALQQGMSPSQGSSYSDIRQTFNLKFAPGSDTTPQAIAKELYNQYMGL